MSDCIVVFFLCLCVSTAVSMLHAWTDTGQHTLGIFSSWVENFCLGTRRRQCNFKDHWKRNMKAEAKKGIYSKKISLYSDLSCRAYGGRGRKQIKHFRNTNEFYICIFIERNSPRTKKNASPYNSRISIEFLIGSNEFYCFILCHETL